MRDGLVALPRAAWSSTPDGEVLTSDPCRRHRWEEWKVFSSVWNDIVTELYSVDLLSGKELKHLVFVDIGDLDNVRPPLAD